MQLRRVPGDWLSLSVYYGALGVSVNADFEMALDSATASHCALNRRAALAKSYEFIEPAGSERPGVSK